MIRDDEDDDFVTPSRPNKRLKRGGVPSSTARTQSTPGSTVSRPVTSQKHFGSASQRSGATPRTAPPTAAAAKRAQHERDGRVAVPPQQGVTSTQPSPAPQQQPQQQQQERPQKLPRPGVPVLPQPSVRPVPVPAASTPRSSQGAAPAAAAATAACPICGVDLGRISCTALGREAHVNACLDAAVGGGGGGGSSSGGGAAMIRGGERPHGQVWGSNGQQQQQQRVGSGTCDATACVEPSPSVPARPAAALVSSSSDTFAGGSGTTAAGAPVAPTYPAMMDGGEGDEDEWLDALQTQMWEGQEREEEAGGVAAAAARARVAEEGSGGAAEAGAAEEVEGGVDDVDGAGETDEPELERWLACIGLDHLAGALRLAGAEAPDDVATMSDGDLQAAGIGSSAERRLLLSEVSLLSEPPAGPPGDTDATAGVAKEGGVAEEVREDGWLWEADGTEHVAWADDEPGWEPEVTQQQWQLQQQQERQEEEGPAVPAGGWDGNGWGDEEEEEEVVVVGEREPPAQSAAPAPRQQPEQQQQPATALAQHPDGWAPGGGAGANAPARQPLHPFNSMFVRRPFREGEGKITAFFKPPAKPESILQQEQLQQQQQQQGPGGQQHSRQQPASVWHRVAPNGAPSGMAARNFTGPAAAAAGPSRPTGPQYAAAVGAPLPAWVRPWQRIPSTNIVVDCFTQQTRSLATRSWILSHFHADHYGGLTKGFKQGVIYCTPTTAALVRLKIKVAEANLRAVPLGQEFVVEGTRVTFLDANHCPGAALIVAHPPDGMPPVLHTGDARLTREATRECPVLGALRGRAVLVLDTTYCDPQYCFPSQKEVVDSVIRAVQAESFNPRTLFLFGSYTIGKERVFLSAAAAMNKKLYVAAAKRAVLGCIDLAPEYRSLLTTDHLETNMHAVPMRQVTVEAMEALLLRYRGRYTTVVGFCPTGWSMGRTSKGLSKRGRRSQNGTVVLYNVPYSEHSSFAELRGFVAWFNPIRIIPSVGNDNGGPKAQAMVKLLRGDRGPMDAFTRAAAAGAQPAGGASGSGGGGGGAQAQQQATGGTAAGRGAGGRGWRGGGRGGRGGGSGRGGWQQSGRGKGPGGVAGVSNNGAPVPPPAAPVPRFPPPNGGWGGNGGNGGGGGGSVGPAFQQPPRVQEAATVLPVDQQQQQQRAAGGAQQVQNPWQAQQQGQQQAQPVGNPQRLSGPQESRPQQPGPPHAPQQQASIQQQQQQRMAPAAPATGPARGAGTSAATTGAASGASRSRGRGGLWAAAAGRR